MVEPRGRPSNRMPDNEVNETLNRLDGLLAEVELTPGPAGEIAVEAVSALARLYGEALARAFDYVADTPVLCEAFLRDELLGHLLVLHDIHPEPVADRVSRAVDALSRRVHEHGGEIEFAGVESGVATIRLSTHGCGSSSAGVADVVREEVLAVAPELSSVEVVKDSGHDNGHDTAFIPLQGLKVRPHATGAGV